MRKPDLVGRLDLLPLSDKLRVLAAGFYLLQKSEVSDPHVFASKCLRQQFGKLCVALCNPFSLAKPSCDAAYLLGKQVIELTIKERLKEICLLLRDPVNFARA